jgi:putative PIN family toxin of toxin-antitoxin system
MVRIVIDANVLISASFGGTPLDAVGKAFSIGKIFVSPLVVAEIEATVHHLAPKLGSERTLALLRLWIRLRARCTVIEPLHKIEICRDSKDDAYLALCAAAEADVLITGDNDLLVVDPALAPGLPRGLKILTPRQFVEQYS